MANKSSSAQSKYSQPELRESIKQRLKEGDKGGQPGQWSARKSQMLAAEYKKQGGGYAEKQDESQKSLEKWGGERWQTANNTKAVQGKKTSRYLPKKAWDTMRDRKSTRLNSQSRQSRMPSSA